jgi:hypothetical protein
MSPALGTRHSAFGRLLAPPALLALLAVAARPNPAVGQEPFRGGGGSYRGEIPPNVPYDGRFTFARIKFTSALGGDFGFRGRDLPWSHDYPRGERHFTRILAELTTLRPRIDESNIFALDDPELLKFPVAYLCEPGFWTPSEKEVEGLRTYLLKGGFLIFDDFLHSQWFNFETQIRRVLPGANLVRLTPEHPIFDSFYRIGSLDYNHPLFDQPPSEFWGIFEDNDPSRRLMVIVNYNNDIGEYWEFSDTGMFPIDLSNTAYKLGVNYVVYALTR